MQYINGLGKSFRRVGKRIVLPDNWYNIEEQFNIYLLPKSLVLVKTHKRGAKMKIIELMPYLVSNLAIVLFPQIGIGSSAESPQVMTHSVATEPTTFATTIVVPNPSSLQEEMASLQGEQESLKFRLTDVQNRFAALQNFVKAQHSLNLTWTDALKNQHKINGLMVDLGNGQNVEICHAKFQQGIHPGKVVEGGCLITYGGDALIIPTYQVLTGNTKTQWMPNNNIDQYKMIDQKQFMNLWQQTSFPIQGGFENSTPLFICKATYNNQTYIGKVVLNICDIDVQDKEMSISDFQVLFGSK